MKVRQEFLILARDRVRAGEQTMAEAMAQARRSEARRRRLEHMMSAAVAADLADLPRRDDAGEGAKA